MIKSTNMNGRNITEMFAENINALSEKENADFMVLMGIGALGVQVGFGFFEVGLTRRISTLNTITKNIFCLMVGALVYWATGFAFAYGKPGNILIGYGNFFLSSGDFSNISSKSTETAGPLHNYWFFEYIFALCATSIASGAMAERVTVGAYIVYSAVMSGFIYPVVSHWCWSDEGWLQTGIGTKLSFLDFSGSGVVHLTGGTAALLGSAIIGSRYGRFHQDGSIEDYRGHSLALTSIGSYLLFFGMFALNGGSAYTFHANMQTDSEVGKVITSVLISGASGALTTMTVCRITDYWKKRKSHLSLLWAIKGGLAGVVAISAISNDVKLWGALVIGILAGSLVIDLHYFLLYLNIDDPVDAVSVHFGGGLCGVIFGPFFAERGIIMEGQHVGGILFSGSIQAWKSLSWNLAGASAIIMWTGVCTGFLFGVMSSLKILRVNKENEIQASEVARYSDPNCLIENDIDHEELLKNFG